MSWHSRFQQGRFRGVPFLIQGHEHSGGRRLALHEYPLRDAPYAEDLGRKAREWSIELYVLGADYMAARDKLIEAFEKQGPGTLTHPYLGLRQVAVREYRLRESTREGGLATFSVTFVEAGPAQEPDAQADTAGAVGDAANTAETSAIADFAKRFSVDGLPDLHLAEVEAELGRTLDGLTDIVGDVTGPIAAEIRAPVNMGTAIVAAMGKIKTVATEPLRALKLYETLFTAGNASPAVPTTTATREQQAQTTQALHLLTQRAAILGAARASAEADYASLNDALDARDRLLAAIDTQIETTDVVAGTSIDDDTYQAFAALRVALAEDLLIRGGKLPRVTRYTPPATLPALVIAHRLYGDATRAAEIVTRNKIRHPLFVPGGQALEVLNA